MRIWDVHPGYLNRGSLLGEHRELHGVLAIVERRMKGYARHPETMRWRRHLPALRLRHDIIGAEMALRGYRDLTPVPRVRRAAWPTVFIDPPAGQLALLRQKYASREPGRIPLPRSNQELWAAHKYSILARDQAAYRAIGRTVSRLRRGAPLDSLALELVQLLRLPPPAGDLRNAILHMSGHLPRDTSERSFPSLQRRALACHEPYLIASTALSDLAVWLGTRSPSR